MANRHLPLVLSVLLISPLVVRAQSSNGTHTLIQDVVSSAGGSLGGGNPMSARTTLGLPAGGRSSNQAFTLIGGLALGQAATTPPITMTITVTGAINDPLATVTVNDKPAVISTNTFTVDQIVLLLGPNQLTAVATDQAGNTTSVSITVYLDIPAADKTPKYPIEVRGTVDDPLATVMINGEPAAIAPGVIPSDPSQFTATVLLSLGSNTLTATATDQTGNSSSAVLQVFVRQPPLPPPMPTVGTVGNPIPAVTTQSSLTIGGTKTPGTSIWINGTQIVPLNDLTTWTMTTTLVEGDNEFMIVAKDAAGTASAPVMINVIVDNLPPVVTFTPPVKTNFNPVVLRGAVDDSSTTVTINGLIAQRTKRDFEVSVPLTPGPNTLQLRAVSPNGYVTQTNYTITLGTVPSVNTVQPADGTKLSAGSQTNLQASATDQENDPIQYQFLLDGVPLGPQSPTPSLSWTPALGQLGFHTLTARASDAYGGSHDKNVEVFVIRLPVQHP